MTLAINICPGKTLFLFLSRIIHKSYLELSNQ